ncbi:MAG: hypothetical protein LBT20_06825, partial [Clostridiales bacterium]|nr:hypothetical protein [Clostridiales bacterium]
NRATRIREEATARLIELKNQLNALEQEKAKLIGDGDIYTVFTREYGNYNRLAHQVGKIDTYNDNIKQLTKKKQINNGEIEKDTLELDRAEATKLNAERNLYNVNAKTEVSQREREKVANANYYVGISNSVRVGEFCPVCGNVLTVKQPKTPISIVPMDMEITKLRDDRTKAEEILANVIAVIAGLNANVLHMKRLNQDLDRDENFYIDCINDILKEEGYESVQLLYEAFLRQKERYEQLKVIYDRAGAILVETNDLKDRIRDAEAEAQNADREIAIYSEQYNERKYAIAGVSTRYERELVRYATYNSLSEYEDPAKILDRLEKMAVDRAAVQKEYEKKAQTKKELEKLVTECDNLEILILSKSKPGQHSGGAVSYSEFILSAVTGKYGSVITDVLKTEEKSNEKCVEIETLQKKYTAIAERKNVKEVELAGVTSQSAANQKQIENLQKDYIRPIDGAPYTSAEELESYVIGYFVQEESISKLNEYRIRVKAFSEERDELASVIDNTEEEKGDPSELASEYGGLENEIAELEKEIIRIDCETDRIKQLTFNREFGEEVETVERELETAEKLQTVANTGVYSDYVASLNAEAILKAADADVAAISNGRYSLSFADGIRVKDKLFGDKYRTLNTLDESERLTIGTAIAASTARLIGKNATEILFIDGFEFAADAYSAEIKKITKKIGESYAYTVVLLKDELEESKNVVRVVASESGESTLVS